MSVVPDEAIINTDDEEAVNNLTLDEINQLLKDVESKAAKSNSSSNSPPMPPKRSSQTNQRLKRWSKMIKYSLPSKLPSNGNSKPKSPERKSLKERLTEGELAVFLRERRAVSESRFRILDKLNMSGLGVRTKSDPKINASDDGWKSGITTGSLSSLKQKFESPPPSPLKSPTVVKSVLSKSSLQSPEPTSVKSPIARFKVTLTDGNNSTTSPESGLDEVEKKKVKGSKKGSKNKDKKDKKKGNGGKKKHSTCSACNSDQEHKEKKKEKKRLKKEKSDAKRKVTIANGRAETPEIPPYPKIVDSTDWTKSKREKFFQKLLIKASGEEKENSPQKGILVDRKSRSSHKRDVRNSTTPTLNPYLQQKRIVSESIFKRFSLAERQQQQSTLPPGVRLGEQFFDQRQKFENGSKPVATFPRSISNLEKRSDYSSFQQRKTSPSPGRRPPSALSNASSGVDQIRSTSLPRRPPSALSDAAKSTTSVVDPEEYRKYILETMHAAPKNDRFIQLQNYYNVLDRALKLEKKSTSMDIHKLKSDEVIDFETWRKLRHKEKANDELKELLSDLKAAQKQRNFFFRPKDVDSVKWRGDAHLRGRDKSVDNLRNHFNKIVAQNGATEENANKMVALQQEKDVYKPLWRAKSVSNVAEDITTNTAAAAAEKPKSSTLGKWEERKRATKSSSLTAAQVSSLKGHLNEILSTKPINVNGLPRPGRMRTSAAENNTVEADNINAERRRNRSPFRNPTLITATFDMQDAKPPIKFDSNFKTREKSPRVCHSLENVDTNHSGDVKENKERGDDSFLLVLNQDNSKSDEVKNVVDVWASGDESGSDRGRKKGKKDNANKSSDSLSSSGNSTNTVIRKQKSVEEIRKSFEVLPVTKADNSSSPAIEDRDKSVEELRKSFESPKPENLRVVFQDSPDILNPSCGGAVQEIRKSFERLPRSPELKTRSLPMRKRHVSADGQARSATIGHLRGKSNLSYKNRNNNNSSSSAERMCRSPSPDMTKYGRSYLALVKAGEIAAKKHRLESPPPQNLPEVDSAFIESRLTDLSKQALIKPHEIGDLHNIRRRLLGQDNKASQTIDAALATQSKSKLKHLCNKIGHSRILGKMVALSASQNELDEGAVKLFERAVEEKEHFGVYRAGQVESKVDRFEKWGQLSQCEGFGEMERRYPLEPAPTFSWSKRFDTNLPKPSESYTRARRHEQFRTYYGYFPSDAPRINSRSNDVSPVRDRVAEIEAQPSSLPSDINIPIYSKVKKKSQSPDRGSVLINTSCVVMYLTGVNVVNRRRLPLYFRYSQIRRRGSQYSLQIADQGRTERPNSGGRTSPQTGGTNERILPKDRRKEGTTTD